MSAPAVANRPLNQTSAPSFGDRASLDPASQARKVAVLANFHDAEPREATLWLCAEITLIRFLPGILSGGRQVPSKKGERWSRVLDKVHGIEYNLM